MSGGEGGGNTLVKALILTGFLAATCGVLGLAGVMMWDAPSDVPPPVTPQGTPVATKASQPEVHTPANVPTGKAAIDRIKKRGVLLVATDTGEPPFSGTPPMFFTGASGDPDGFDMALARQIASAIGVSEIKPIHAKYSDLEDLLVDPEGKVDVVISGYAPDEAPGISWSKSYLEYGLCLIVPAKSPIKTTNDLFGKPIGIFDDDAAADEVKKLVKGYTEMVRLEDGYWDQLLQGRFAGFLYDYPYAAAEINAWYKQNPSRAGSLRIAQYNLTDSSYSVGVRQGEPELLAVVDQAIATWRDSDAYGAAIKQYLSGGLAVEAPVEGKVHVVKAGETLSLIAKEELGSVDRWTDLWKANQSRFPNPHLIDVGDKVVIP
ncbi:MAG: transporter substrate-binding domain-containing protein [Alphaproteobacteria bacterium]|nr:transporter substrate-binding domain-containing protein [Alphaproteobacteria bacterium]